MKFTKEQAYEDLVAKMTSKGEKLNLSSRTMNKHLETLIKFVANDEMELSDFVGKVLPDFIELDGQYRKDNSDFINQWKKDHPDVAKPNAASTTNPNQSTEMNDEQKAMMERLKLLEDRIAKDDKERNILTKKEELQNAMKSKGIKDKAWMEQVMSLTQITEDMNVDEKADALLKFYNQSHAGFSLDTTPHSSSGKQDDYKALFEAVRKEIEESLKK